MDKYETAANLAFFLLEKTGTIYGTWRGKLTAQEQRSLLGCFLGKGTIEINGALETIRHTVKVCFGHDFDDTHFFQWGSIETKRLQLQEAKIQRLQWQASKEQRKLDAQRTLERLLCSR